MSMLVMSAALALVPVTQIDLAAPGIFISKDTRELIAAGEVETLTCGALRKRDGGKFRIACLTQAEIRNGAERGEAQDKARQHDGGAYLDRVMSVDGARSLSARSGGPRN